MSFVVPVLVAIFCVLCAAVLWLCLSKRKLQKELVLQYEKSRKLDNDSESSQTSSKNLKYQSTRTQFNALAHNDDICHQKSPTRSCRDAPFTMETLLESSRCITKGSPSIYKLPVKITKTEIDSIEKGEIGVPNPFFKPTRVFMVIGATGSGKSTLINGIINYVLGVKFEDEHRFKLITDEESGGQSQVHSQTQKITSYTIYWYEGSRVDYNLTIIDTPGFGDTRGLQRDRQITGQIKDFFSMRGDNGIDQIHGIGFVAQSSLARLTPTQKYVFDSILSVFGKDIVNNIFLMATFADGSEPPVRAAVEAAKFPYCELIKLNNELLFQPKSSNRFSKMYWDMAYDSFKHFFIAFTITDAVSLQLTRDVLKERQHLENFVARLQKRITAGVAKIDELKQEEEVLRRHESEVLANKDTEYTVTVTKQKKIDMSEKKHVTNCLQCNFTCHIPCAFGNNSDKKNCTAMNTRGYCNACPGHCYWTKHQNNSYYFELIEEEETRTLKGLRDKFEDASKAKISVKTMIDKITEQLESCHRQVLRDIREARQSIERLSEIALKPNTLTDVQYVDLLIQSEETEKKPGFLKRVKYLEEIKLQAEFIANDFEDSDIDAVSQQRSKALQKRGGVHKTF